MQIKTSLATTPKPETIHSSFEWLRSKPISSLNLTVEEYRHTKTGAMHYHMAAENTENVFLVALRTVPMDSTGVAHMLEHTALCGSKKYPVRDPFFMMIRRSLNTFMNAFTSSDWTAYPFASQNRKDFFNLLDVYLDAVFFSRLDELDFAQEGHRLEYAEKDNANSELLYKGVVFNEMKGALSSPVSQVWEALYTHLYPTTTYHYNSGGDPENITDLSYAELKDFYKIHYHPSNAVFMTYGDVPANEYHEIFENNVLKDFDKLETVIKVDDEKRYNAPIVVEGTYGIDTDESLETKSHVVIAWLLGHNTDLEGVLSSHLLSSILLDNSASPLRKALETSDLGVAPSSLCGLDDSNHELTFMCGLEGCKADDAQAIEDLILNVLNDVIDNGVELENVEAVLHQLELGQREVSGDGYPYGLSIILEGLSCAMHRGDPVELLNVDPVIESLRTKIQDPEYVKNLVKENIINNMHRVRLTMKPDAALNKQKEEKEKAKLAAINESLSADAKQKIVDQAQALEARQASEASEDDVDILPQVTLQDVPVEMSIAEGSQDDVNGISVSRYAQPTNGLVYQQVICRLPKIEADALSCLPHYTSCLTRLGVADKDYLAVQNWQYSVSGGVNAFSTIRGAVDDANDLNGYFILSGKALQRNQKALSELMQNTFESVRFDEHERIRELVSQKRVRAEQSVTGNGHGLAMLAAAAGISKTAKLAQSLRGLDSIKDLKSLDDRLADKKELVMFAEQLSSIHKSVSVSQREFLLITEAEQLSASQDIMLTPWSLPASNNDATDSFKKFSLDASISPVKQAWLTNTQVNFCAKAYAGVTLNHPDSAALTVLAGFMRNGFLHTNIREKGGAYGGGASYDSESASFRFYSYRDPRLVETLQDFDRSIDWVISNTHEPRLLEEAILGVIGSLDKPGSPAGEAKDAFQSALFGRTALIRQAFRQSVLAVTLADLRDVAERYLIQKHENIAIITNETNLESSNIAQTLGFELEVLKL